MALVCTILGICCLLYCAAVFAGGGYGSLFFLIWGILGGLFLLTARAVKEGWLHRLPPAVQIAGGLCLGVILLCFAATELCIASGFFAGAKEESPVDCLIVLGAQMKESGPSAALQKRLDKAADYLQSHPDAVAVLSGGQGSDEPVSEAEGMFLYLTEKKGIAPQRLLLEDQSRNTRENLEFSARLIDKEEPVGIVTNGFHIFRSLKMAQKAGYTQVQGIAAPESLPYLPNNMLREFFSVIKAWVTGAI